MSAAEMLLPEGQNVAVSALTAAVTLEPVPQDDTVSGTPRQGVADLGTIGDVAAGIWELRAGVVTDTEVDELFIVVSGEATIEVLAGSGAGTTTTVRADDVMRLVAGTRTRWSVKDHIRKIYIAAE